MRKPPTTSHAIAYFFLALLLFVGVGTWIFLRFFFEDFLNAYAVPKLEEAAMTATHGVYRLKLDRVYYQHFKIFCTGFDLQRVHYDSGASGIAVKRVMIDTVEFTGVNIFKIVIRQSLSMTSLQMDSPRVFIADLAKEKATGPDPQFDSLRNAKAPSSSLPAISFDSIALRTIRLYLPDRPSIQDIPSFQGISLRLTDFYFNSETKEAQPILFSKRVDVAIPNVKYPVGSGLYSFEFKNLHGNSEDSVITADHFGFVPNFSDQAFAARSRYAAPRLNFECNGVRIEGFNFASAISHSNLIFRTFRTSGWLIDSYEDRSKPSDPNPPKALMPNDLISSLPVKLDIDSMIFSNGEIRIREHKNGTTASLGFTRANVTVSPISKDTIGRHTDEASRITFRAYFLGVAELAGTAVYPLHHKTFDLDIHADLGGFSVERLNPWLVPFERVEVTGGQVRKGTIDMSIRSGVATTKVVPIYSGFSVKVLAADPHAQPGLMEKLKTFIAKTFILDHENPDENKILPGITTHARAPSDEFMKFIWESLRASLGQVVGFQRTG